ncbi:MAG: class I SAM-dependent methyltransferase [Bacilli bacterium]
MGQYFDNDNSIKSNIVKHSINILDKNFTFFTDNGVFSKNKLDYGTRFLLEVLTTENIGNKVLDVGCGYGPIGIYISKVFNSHVDMIDINKRAIHLCQMNIKENNVNCKAFVSDCYEKVDDFYDTIITNPPIRAGKKIIYEIVMSAHNYLIENGVLYIVIRKDQGAKSMISDLKKIYNVEVLDKSKGFFVIKCKKY